MTNSCFGFCRDCGHWQATEDVRLELEETYFRDTHPDDSCGWSDKPCNRIQDGVQIELDLGWDGGRVDKVITDANFGCRFFKAFKNQ